MGSYRPLYKLYLLLRGQWGAIHDSLGDGGTLFRTFFIMVPIPIKKVSNHFTHLHIVLLLLLENQILPQGSLSPLVVCEFWL